MLCLITRMLCLTLAGCALETRQSLGYGLRGFELRSAWPRDREFDARLGKSQSPSAWR